MTDEPFTPNMRFVLRLISSGSPLAGGRPTRQRLAKYGFAEFVTPRDWDGPMRITTKGINRIARRT